MYFYPGYEWPPTTALTKKYNLKHARRFYDDGIAVNDVLPPQWWGDCMAFWYKGCEVGVELTMDDNDEFPIIKIIGNDWQNPATRALIHVTFKIEEQEYCPKTECPHAQYYSCTHHHCPHSCARENHEYIGIFTDGDIYFYDDEHLQNFGIDLPLVFWHALCAMLPKGSFDIDALLARKLREAGTAP